jgi:vacuolar-type H+-ATPase subunit D/Vma8
LSDELRKVLQQERHTLDDLLNKAQAHFSHFMVSFWERLNHRLQAVMGVTIPIKDWPIDIQEIENPDISVSWSFDIQLDLLWFLFPMSLFRNIFFGHFQKKIPFEVEKNIQRAISDLTEMINKEIDRLHFQTLSNIENELNTIDTLLSDQKTESAVISKMIGRIKDARTLEKDAQITTPIV